MNEQISGILSNVGLDSFEIIARGMLDDTTASVIGQPQFDEIKSSHNDLRTIGIVRASGDALSAGAKKRWSAVAKIIDPTKDDEDEDDRSDITPEIEQTVYELRLFTGEDIPIRPAKCYFTQRVEDRFQILWLEDLSRAPQPPWRLEHFVNAANHLGQFAGYHITHRTQVPFEIQRDWYLTRFRPERTIANAQSLLSERESYQSEVAYRNVPIESVMAFAELLGPLYTAGQNSPHCLSFGDTHSRNMFPLERNTVVIDLGFIGSEPVGADVGVLIGSALTYTTSEAQMVAANERDIYDSYIAGLKATGWDGDESLARIGFFCQFAGYLSRVSVTPVILQDFLYRREWVEGRFGVPFDDVPAHLAPVIELLPRYVEELKGLLGEVGSCAIP